MIQWFMRTVRAGSPKVIGMDAGIRREHASVTEAAAKAPDCDRDALCCIGRVLFAEAARNGDSFRSGFQTVFPLRASSMHIRA